MAEYRDLYLRQSLAQTTPAHYGGPASPDIVPWGAAQNPDPAALGTKMSVDAGRALVPGHANFLYVRTTNGDAAREHVGQIFLGRTAPTYLLWPDLLASVPNRSGGDYFQLKVPGGAVGVSTDAFTYTPKSSGDSLASWVFTRDHPVDLPDCDRIEQLEQFIAETPAYAQRSAGFGVDGAGEYRFVGAYDQRDSDAFMLFAIKATDCAGCTISMLPESGGDRIRLEPLVVPTDDFSLSLDRDLPAHYTTSLALRISRPAAKLKPTAQLRVTVYFLSDGKAPVDAQDEQTLIPMGGHVWFAHEPGSVAR